MTPREISLMLAKEAESIARMLLPNGKRSGHEWRAGNVHGAEGDSLGVHLSGDKAGVWADFSTGQAGDLLDLWMAVEGIGLSEVLDKARKHLGLREYRNLAPERAYKPADRPKCRKPDGDALSWLKGRGLDKSLSEYKIATDGLSVVFPSLVAGELRRWKRRSIHDKHQCQTSSDSEPCLFGWQAIPENAREVVICEGEIDALSWWEMGYPALSVPSGAKSLSWIEVEYPRLERFDSIYLAMDADQAGQEVVPKIIDRLGRERVLVVDTSPHKDANDLLLANGDAKKCIENAKSLDPDELKAVDFYRQAVVDIFTGKAKAVQGYALPWEKVGERFRIRPSEVTILAGENFSGKSEVAGHLAVEIMDQGARACVASLEMNPEDWISKIARQVGQIPIGTATETFANHVIDWLAGKLWVFGIVGTSKVERILDVFSYAVKRYGIFFFVIDNLQKCGIRDDDWNAQKEFVDRLTDFAKEHRCHVILVHHLNKSEDDKPGSSHRVKGSGGITDMADNVVIWWRNRAKERKIEEMTLLGQEIGKDIDGQPDSQFVVEKQRKTGDTPKVNLWFDKRSGQFLGHKSHKSRMYCGWKEVI